MKISMLENLSVVNRLCESKWKCETKRDFVQFWKISRKPRVRFNDLECMLQKLEDIDAETDAMRHELYAQWNSVARKDSDNSSSDLDYRIQVDIRKCPICFVNGKFIRFSKKNREIIFIERTSIWRIFCQIVLESAVK